MPEAERTPLIVLLLDIIRCQQEQIEQQQKQIEQLQKNKVRYSKMRLLI